MKAVSTKRFFGDQSGAVAATYALALIPLIAFAGVAMDYGRLMGMDSELQNGADQAALAAATQLDGRSDTCARASAAAVNLLSNSSFLTSDNNTLTVTDEPDCDQIGNIRFYATEDRAPATGPATAKFVEVTIDARGIDYALIPITGAIGPDLTGTALAGLGAAICNTPPVMMCNPSEPTGNLDEDYPFNASKGDGVKLVISSPSAPGNFGFLQTGYGTGAQDLAKALGYDNPPADCAAYNGVDTEPGDKQSVRAAFNTRFDMSDPGQTCPDGGPCSPSRNTRKDLVLKGGSCNKWEEAPNPYAAPSATVPLASDGSEDPDIMGYPRDMCHAVSLNGQCGIVGDGVWDRDAYFRVNYGWNNSAWRTNTGLAANATRHDVYLWELANPTLADMQQDVGGNLSGFSYPVCRPPGVTPGENTPDRRRITVAVINCYAEGVNGREYGVHVANWIDVFLVEPAHNRARTTNGDVYVEVIEPAQVVGGGGSPTAQTVVKMKPYLVE